MDTDDIDQAIEIALGDRLEQEMGRSQSISDGVIKRQRTAFKRILRELPGHTTVQELLDVMGD